MSIIGITGGIGSGKTLTLAHFLWEDLRGGRRIFTNLRLKKLGKYEKQVTYLTKEFINSIFEQVKAGNLDMRKSTIGIQEAHNYADSRMSNTKRNLAFTYFILQSRHFSADAGCVIWDSQSMDQIDKRLRRNTDYLIQPTIIHYEKRGTYKIPYTIKLDINAKIGQSWRKGTRIIDVSETRNRYDTHEIVDF